MHINGVNIEQYNSNTFQSWVEHDFKVVQS